MVSRDKNNNSSSSPQNNDYDENNNITRVARACTNCRKAHRRCDMQRPCSRCVRLNLPNCVDYKAKKRGRKKNTALWRQLSESEGFHPSPSSSTPQPNKLQHVNLIHAFTNSEGRSPNPHQSRSPSNTQQPLFHQNNISSSSPSQLSPTTQRQQSQHIQPLGSPTNITSQNQMYFLNNPSSFSNPMQQQQQHHHHQQKTNSNGNVFSPQSHQLPTAHIRSQSVQNTTSQGNSDNNGTDQKTRIVLQVPQPNISYNSNSNAKSPRNWAGNISQREQLQNNESSQHTETETQSNNYSNNQDNSSNKIVIKMPSNT